MPTVFRLSYFRPLHAPARPSEAAHVRKLGREVIRDSLVDGIRLGDSGVGVDPTFNPDPKRPSGPPGTGVCVLDAGNLGRDLLGGCDDLRVDAVHQAVGDISADLPGG